MRIQYKVSLSSYKQHKQQQPFAPIKRAAGIDIICGGVVNDNNTLDRFRGFVKLLGFAEASKDAKIDTYGLTCASLPDELKSWQARVGEALSVVLDQAGSVEEVSCSDGLAQRGHFWRAREQWHAQPPAEPQIVTIQIKRGFKDC
eukprot:scaffold49599_cov40-Prasinocladus_malaysianus.AAC.3